LTYIYASNKCQSKSCILQHIISVSSPRASPSRSKYKEKGPYNEGSFPTVPLNLRNNLVQAANFSVSSNTHSTYTSALASWQQCCRETRISGNFPVSEDDTLTYVAWLLGKGSCTATISTYLSGIRAAHLEKGLNPPTIRSDRVNVILSGSSKRDNIMKKTGLKKVRIPITPTSLKLWKSELNNCDLSYHDKRLVWSVSAILFFGALRPGEVLCKNHNSFDPVTSLLQRDITIKETVLEGRSSEYLQVYLSSEKTNTTGTGRLIDIYESNEVLCPIRAYKKLQEISNMNDPEKPAFRLESGKNLTTNFLNKKLKEGLGKHLNSSSGFVSGHSFRIGVASLVAQMGYSEEQIKSLGRWSSQAYMSYLRLPRTRRQEMAKALKDAAR